MIRICSACTRLYPLQSTGVFMCVCVDRSFLSLICLYSIEPVRPDASFAVRMLLLLLRDPVLLILEPREEAKKKKKKENETNPLPLTTTTAAKGDTKPRDKLKRKKVLDCSPHSILQRTLCVCTFLSLCVLCVASIHLYLNNSLASTSKKDQQWAVDLRVPTWCARRAS